MVRYRSCAEGFTLLEALVALAILGAVVVVGLEGVGLGAAARVRAADRASLRLLAERKLAELAVLPGTELEALVGVTEERFEPPFGEAEWSLRVREVEPGSGLFAFELEVRGKEGVMGVAGELNRFGELWRRRHVPTRQGAPHRVGRGPGALRDPDAGRQRFYVPRERRSASRASFNH